MPSIVNTYRELFEHKISEIQSGSTDQFESGSSPDSDPKHWLFVSSHVTQSERFYPVKAAYIRKLQQQADSIRQLLKLLNNGTSSSSSQPAYNKSSSEDMAQGNGVRLDNREEEEGYEQLWQLGTNCNGELQGGA
jgi:hypothetical protein